ncbi:MAG: Asp-tRNA(Asn)/Glu-tRNA(Gln) amidotransferase subunit GatB [Chloroflexi bacterium]|nr:Asp-tRNA(Asn)/Glu-tRNA(Gln) amidotransferase subunit GatB [Chloroflexota bacterium]BCY17199.1 aspartyl/glutamyl-tRNA(Asn/Gln) amidotransferase subunit B [Leptolinea sp. HRD-7]
MEYEVVIGLEVHAEMATRTKMFCSCPVVDSTQAEPNTTVCPVCAGMPGVLPVVNKQAVEYGMKVGLALGCTINHTSLFDRKNYFYPDLPKGYQISQYEHPLASDGLLVVDTSKGEKAIRIRRAHLEEDTGKLTHVEENGQNYSLVDLNRCGVPLLEIVTEPDIRSIEEAKAYATTLRGILRALGVNSGDMEKGVIRFEANISVREAGTDVLNNRVEIKNLNSFRAMERGIAYEIDRQIKIMESGGTVAQETLGWDEANGCTYTQRSKEDAHDYRYFPEPDLPPLVVDPDWVHRVRASLPELPRARAQRYQADFGLTVADSALLAADTTVAEFFEKTAAAANGVPGKTVAAWILGEVGAYLNRTGENFENLKIKPETLADLLTRMGNGEVNAATAKVILSTLLEKGGTAGEIIKAQGLQQTSDLDLIASLVAKALAENPSELESYKNGKETVANWFFGQVMRMAGGKANPQVVREELARQLKKA